MQSLSRPLPLPAAPRAAVRRAAPAASRHGIASALLPTPTKNHAPLPAMFEITIAASLASVLLLGTGLAAQDMDSNFARETVIVCLCLLGSLIGGFLGVAWKPGQTARQNYFLFGSNLAAGFLFGPLLVAFAAPRLAHVLTPGPILCIASGGLVSAFGILLLKLVMPPFIRALKTRARNIAEDIANEK